jgi:mRNA interferase RelE/StbE
MTYRIVVERKASKELGRLPKSVQERLVQAIDSLAETPRPPGCRPVKAAPKGTYRIRIGDYRIIYAVMDEKNIVIIARIALRGEQTYRGL